MKPHVERQHSLHCDECHYEVDIDRIHKGMIGSWCPRCSTIMFTGADWRAYQRIQWKLKLQEWLYRGLCVLGAIRQEGLLNRTTIKDGKVK